MQNNIEKFREEANNLVTNSKYAELISLCDKKNTELSGETQEEREILSLAYYMKGNVFYINEDYETATEYYTKAIELNPYNAKAYNNRGSAKDKLGLHSEAKEDYKKSKELKEKEKEEKPINIETNPDGSSMEYYSSQDWAMWQSHILFKTKDGILVKKEMFYDPDFKDWGVTTEYFRQENGSCIEIDKVDNRKFLHYGDIDVYYVKRVKDTKERIISIENSLENDFSNILSKNLYFYEEDGSRTEYEYQMQIKTPEQIVQAGLFPVTKVMYNSSGEIIGTVNYYDFDCKKPALIRNLEHLDTGKTIDKGVFPEKHPFGGKEHSYIRNEYSSDHVLTQKFADTNFTDLIESIDYKSTEYGHIQSTSYPQLQWEEPLQLTYKSVIETLESPIAQEEYCKLEYFTDENFNNICCVYEYKIHRDSNVDFSCERKAVYTELESGRDFLSLTASEQPNQSVICYYSDNNFTKLLEKEIHTLITNTDENYIEIKSYDSNGNLLKVKQVNI